MSYTPTEWSTGDTITAALLNKMENGIAAGGGASYDFMAKMEDGGDPEYVSGDFSSVVAKMQAGGFVDAVFWTYSLVTDEESCAVVRASVIDYNGTSIGFEFGSIGYLVWESDNNLFWD